MQSVWVLIPASGIGSRMESEIPKQYLPFKNSTVIEATLDRLLSHSKIDGVMLVLNSDYTHWESLKYTNTKPVLTTLGGKKRSDSVLNGLNALSTTESTSNMMVMIHDAVRPCVTHQDLSLLIDAANKDSSGAFLASPVADTIKLVDEDEKVIKTVDRKRLWRALTPQAFSFELILKALNFVAKNSISITDDVSAIEALGQHPKAVQGRPDNIKITYPMDLVMAEIFIQHQ